MAYDLMNYIPHYLKDFKDIEKWADKAEVNFNTCDANMFRIVKELRFDMPSPDRLDKLIDSEGTTKLPYKIGAVLSNYFPLTTIDTLRYYLSAWFTERLFTLSYDNDEKTFTLERSDAIIFSEKSLKYVRNLLPLNTELIVVKTS